MLFLFKTYRPFNRYFILKLIWLIGGSGELLPIPDTTDTFKKITTTTAAKVTERDTLLPVNEFTTLQNTKTARPTISAETPDIDLPTPQPHKIDPKLKKTIHPHIETPVDEIKEAGKIFYSVRRKNCPTIYLGLITFRV